MKNPAQGFEDRKEIDVEILEAVPLTVGGPFRDAFPYPGLRPTGRRQTSTFRTFLLENDFLRLTFLPELGGRLHSWWDKGQQRELFEGVDAPVTFVEDQRRGVRWNQGLEWQIGARRNHLGPVDAWLLDDEEATSATLCLAELTSGEPTSWHLLLTMPSDRAELQMELRLFNRGWRPVSTGWRIDVPGFEPTLQTHTVTGWSKENRHAAVRYEVAEFDAPCQRAIRLGARQLLTLGARISAAFGIPSPRAVGDFGALALDGGQLAFAPTETATGAKVVLRTADGQTLEAPADLYPESPFRADLGELEVTALRILDADRLERFRWPESEPLESPAEVDPLERALDALHRGEAAPFAWRSLAENGGTLHVAAQLHALHAVRQREFPAALAHAQEALNSQGEDHLAWWLLAVLQRHLTTDAEGDRPELLNAHFLAPMEPALRAESFLAANVQTKEPSPLVKPLAEHPDALVEVAALLFEAGLFDDLAKWVDEGLRHREVPMLRYFMAEALLSQSRMEVEAVQHLQQASATPVNPPYPWREIELVVLGRLLARFPEDARLQDLIRLAQWAQSAP